MLHNFNCAEDGDDKMVLLMKLRTWYEQMVLNV